MSKKENKNVETEVKEVETEVEVTDIEVSDTASKKEKVLSKVKKVGDVALKTVGGIALVGGAILGILMKLGSGSDDEDGYDVKPIDVDDYTVHDADDKETTEKDD